MSDAPDRLAAALADRYRIERPLGQGGMATVYLAEDLKHNRKVAIKVLKPELAAVIAAERFLAEIKTTARLSHPHILPLFDSGDARGTVYYVMPLVEGESLRQRLDRRGSLPLAEALRIAREVADALVYAHGIGVIHRDIKPENILLEGTHSLVADFGIAHVMSAADDARLTDTGLSIGTPLYMSPEQSAGERFIDGRSDLYSLASVLFEMLAGHPPFPGPSVQAILAQRFTQPAPRLSDEVKDVPAAVDAAVHRALSRDPAERQPSVERFASALGEGDATPAPSAGKSIAVLPFEDMSPDHDNEYFGDGIAEEIINALTKVEGLRVAARTSAFSFKGKHEDLRVVGDKLNVGTVLEGSVRKAGNRLRVTAQLVTATDGYHLWSERYDRDLTDVFAVQDEIAAAIAEKLEVTYVKPATPKTASTTAPKVEAYDAYLKGRSLIAKRGPALREALTCFERAVGLDPSSARAHAGLGDALWWLAYYGLMPRSEALPRARTALTRALELDPDCAEALGTSAAIAIGNDWDIQSARRLFERALAANPQLSDVRLQYATRVLGLADHDDDAMVAEVHRALADDPLSNIVHANAAVGFLFAGRLIEARELAERAVELDRDALAGHLATAMIAASARDFARALPATQTALQLSGRHPWPLSVLASVHAGLGDARRAEAVHEELRARAISGMVESVWLARSALALGRVDEAMDHAMRSVEEREMFGPWITRFPDIEALQSHPRYPELLRKAGL
jgi:TolB-like protein/tRNA A-37 threonylcarbamoyl transferase component Bud32/Tfp pilus assembly protein PilF